MSAHLYIIRGVPGSGKTTFANRLVRSFVDIAVAADDWFDRLNGGCFDASKLSEAHRWCRQTVMQALMEGNSVVVHNTFTTERELAPYIDFCNDHNMPFTVIVMENRHGSKSVHDVPEEKVAQMRDRLAKSIQL